MQRKKFHSSLYFLMVGLFTVNTPVRSDICGVFCSETYWNFRSSCDTFNEKNQDQVNCKKLGGYIILECIEKCPTSSSN